ncbi:MAG: VOC family protein [Chlamydiota bacterium]
MMSQLITGIHHITALASDAQENVEFYGGVLGLRLVKKTINFDVPSVYHLYYGNESGDPGTIMTFFPYPKIPRGRKGNGQSVTTSFSISEDAIDYWINRLNKFNISFYGPNKRFDELFLSFQDHDGLSLELVANKKDARKGFSCGTVPPCHSIKGIFGVTLSEECFEKTANLLEGEMNHTLITEKGNHFRYSASGKPGDFVDIICNPETLPGIEGHGTVHHIAFATESDKAQETVRKELLNSNYNVTPVLDRQYFRSIYFREPGGVLFEVATKPPGFTLDEPLNNLGESLKLPPWQERNRSQIEDGLIPIQLDVDKYAD